MKPLKEIKKNRNWQGFRGAQLRWKDREDGEHYVGFLVIDFYICYKRI